MTNLFLGMITILLFCGCSVFGGEDGAISDTGLNPSNQIYKVELKDYGSAPELAQAIWLNSESPLQLADLRGKVVLVDFWTFG